METKEQDLRILYKHYLSNTLTENGIKELLYRLGELPEVELNALVSEFMFTPETDPADNERESLQRIFSAIQKHHLPAKRIVNFSLYYKIAAAAVILIATTLLLYFQVINQYDDNSIIGDQTVDICPGKEKAILKLSNGKEIDLDTLDANKTNIRQDGVVISKDINGELTYINLIDKEPSDKVEYNTVATPRGGKFKVVLPDATEVWLNSSSSITYPTSFAHAGNRMVKLDGEAYFEVKKSLQENGKLLPFTVVTNQQAVKVLGTHFNINAYSDEPGNKTTLLEGSVNINDKTTLKPGEQAISNGAIMVVKPVDPLDFIDWKTGDFNLKTGDLKTIMRKIARWYDVEIIYDSTAPNNVKLGGWISREKNISSVLNLIQKTGGVHFKLEGRRVTVTK